MVEVVKPTWKSSQYVDVKSHIWVKNGNEPDPPYRLVKDATPIDFDKYPIPKDIKQWFFDDNEDEESMKIRIAKYAREGKPNYEQLKNLQNSEDEKRRKEK